MDIRVETIYLGEKDILKYQLINDNNMIVEFLSLGGIITKILTNDYEGKFENVVLGYKNLNMYVKNPSYLGAIIGRTAGRIYRGTVDFEGKKITLNKNNLENTLHGGNIGFDKKVWSGEEFRNSDNVGVKLKYRSEDGDEGYPGNLNIEVYYILNNKNEFIISIKGVCDEDTLLNITNHSYFNLSGEGKRDILKHELYINSDEICHIDDSCIPTGSYMKVGGTPFDFRIKKEVGRDLNKDHIQLVRGNGYDHPWILKDNENISVEFYDNKSKRALEIKTDQKTVVCYSMNSTDGLLLNNGRNAKPRMACCFETQAPPIGHNQCFKEYSIVKKFQEYRANTSYRFYIKE